jgi:precorrin-8X/cobalt-precorrin-8 methylmutase
MTGRARRLFDVYLAVDWSARSHASPAMPCGDALWVGEALAPGLEAPAPAGETYLRTRRACVGHLRARLLHHLEAERRVLVGCDFPFGYPAGYAAALELRGAAPPWRLIWDELGRLLVDGAANANNRFAVASELNIRCGGPVPGPLWGCPVGASLPSLAPSSPGYPYPVRPGLALERLRWTDRRARGVQPIWKLYGKGSVGGQSLTGIPALLRLRDDQQLAPVCRVWPFDTGFTPRPIPADGPAALYAEIWPGLVPGPLDPALAVRDQAQVRAVVRWLAQGDAAGQLGALFAAPAGLSAALARQTVRRR